ncbi:hypothetical protein FOZ63_013048, partial [Perkinsus olseni]
VRLGDVGGQSVFTIETFKDLLSMDTLIDESRGFDEGFSLPGKVIVLDGEEDPSTAAHLSSMFAEQAWLYPVKSLLAARVDEEARAVFSVRFTQDVYAKEKLIIGVEMVVPEVVTPAPSEGTEDATTTPIVVEAPPPVPYELKSKSFIVRGTSSVQTATAVDKATGNIECLLLGHDGEVALNTEETYVRAPIGNFLEWISQLRDHHDCCPEAG